MDCFHDKELEEKDTTLMQILIESFTKHGDVVFDINASTKCMFLHVKYNWH